MSNSDGRWRSIAATFREQLPRIAFYVTAFCLVLGYGLVARTYGLFPSQFVNKTLQELRDGYKGLWTKSLLYVDPSDIPKQRLPVFYRYPPLPDMPRLINEDGSADRGLTLMTIVAPKLQLMVRLVDAEGEVVHEWDVDWFRLWPDSTQGHIPPWHIPNARPGANLHGVGILKNGNLVLNHSGLGMVCLDYDGDVVWRLERRTHHSIDIDDDGNIWACAYRDRPVPDYAPVDETIVRVSPDGEVLEEWSVIELLLEHDMPGLLNSMRHYLPDKRRRDVVHINDVEAFPQGMEEGFFGRNHVLVSLRNINTVLVFDKNTREIVFLSDKRLIQQHDPDFYDGGSISVFDNRNAVFGSRIAHIDAPTREAHTVYQGTEDSPFFSKYGGKHQWLSNGNLLISSSEEGRVFEVDPEGEIVWQYVNYVDDECVGVLTEAMRLTPEQAALIRP